MMLPKQSNWIIALLALFLPLAAVAQPTPHFEADWTFQGSSLSDWHMLGDAAWEADSGVITGTPGGASGWLVLDRSYQDVQMYLRFRCAEACNTGVLLRMEETDDGYEGVFLDLSDEAGFFRVSLGDDGSIDSRERLLRVGSQVRIAADASEPSELVSFDGDGWQELTIVLDANVVRAHLNGWGGPSGVTGDGSSGYGPVALYVGGSDAVEFVDVGVADYNMRHIAPEQTSDDFTLQQLDEFYYAWDTGIADFNQDGVLDVVAGPYIYLGPDFTTRKEVYLGVTYNPSTEYTEDMVTHAHDFTGDGWPDVLATESRAMVLYVNPRGESRRWTRHEAIPDIISET
ncbi:MAG: DUF1080 domain-containing protein, partial [Rhodothermales bacterium]